MTAVDDRIWLFVMEPPFGPGRSALVRLREKLLSDAPREEVNADFFKTLDAAGSDSFLQVTRSLIYRVEGQDDYREDDKVLLCSRNESVGYINPDGETVYWEDKPPGFWDEWLALPKYTTNYGAALRLKSAVLGIDRTVSLEELESTMPEGEDEVQAATIFQAEMRDTEGKVVRGPTVDAPAVAVLAAMLDYLLSLPVPPAASY